MLSAMIIAGVISLAAGLHIRIWAFTIFALVVAVGFAAVVAASGQAMSAAVLWATACMVLMELSYLVSTFGVGIWRRYKSQSKAASLRDPAHHRAE